jgi:GAF domain-containing protein
MWSSIKVLHVDDEPDFAEMATTFYAAACFVDADTETARLEPRTCAGTEATARRRYGSTRDPLGTGRLRGALREREVAVRQKAHEDARHRNGAWHDAASERGFCSVAAVALEYAEESYGSLVVFSDERDAFDEEERDLLAQIGDDSRTRFTRRRYRYARGQWTRRPSASR